MEAQGWAQGILIDQGSLMVIGLGTGTVSSLGGAPPLVALKPPQLVPLTQAVGSQAWSTRPRARGTAHPSALRRTRWPHCQPICACLH